jgi:hypothetical protein
MIFLKYPEKVPKSIINQMPEIGEAMEELKLLSADDWFRSQAEARLKNINDCNHIVFRNNRFKIGIY